MVGKDGKDLETWKHVYLKNTAVVHISVLLTQAMRIYM